MRVAISTDEEFVSSHFGRCTSFTILDIEKGKVIEKTKVLNPGHEPGAIPQFLHQKKIDCIVCGGMGQKAVAFFKEYGIQTIMGVSGKVDDVVERFLKGELIGGESLCKLDLGKGYGFEKTECDYLHHRIHDKR